MEIINLGFALLVIQVAICVLPGVAGVWCIVSSEDTKRDLRRWICGSLFGVSNAFTYQGFVKFLNITGSILLVLSVGATGFFAYSYLF